MVAACWRLAGMTLLEHEAGFALFLLLCVSLAALFVLLAAVLMALYPTRVGRFFGVRPLPFVGFRRLRELAVTWSVMVSGGALASLLGHYVLGWLPVMIAGWMVMEVGLGCLAFASLGWVAKAARYPMALGWRGLMPMNDVGTEARVLVRRRLVALPFLVLPVVGLVAWSEPRFFWVALVPLVLSAVLAFAAWRRPA